MKTMSLAILVSALLVIVTCSPIFAQDTAAGKAVYAKKCQACHAADGNGNAGMATALKVEFKPLSSDEIQKKSDADLKKVVTAGTGKMKAVTGTTPEDIDNVVAYLRTLKKK
jgi:mono/diheme cytochrome c family protein